MSKDWCETYLYDADVNDDCGGETCCICMSIFENCDLCMMTENFVQLLLANIIQSIMDSVMPSHENFSLE